MTLVSAGTCPLCAADLPGPHMRSCQHWGTVIGYVDDDVNPLDAI